METFEISPRRSSRHNKPRRDTEKKKKLILKEMGIEDGCSPDSSSKNRIEAALKAYNSHYSGYLQEKKKKIKEGRVQKKGTEKRSPTRMDLKLSSQMRKENTDLKSIHRIGHIPGIEVGKEFFSRAEMALVGLKIHWFTGIDFMCQKKYQKVYEEYKFPLGTCIVLSGQYEDDIDEFDTITYTGQGGNNLLGNKQQICHQKLVGGNLALKNNFETKVPVRVIRKHKSKDSYTGMIYTYDGLYMVTSWEYKMGNKGFLVYQYKLERLTGQKELTTSQVQFIREAREAASPPSTANLQGNGQEKIPIPATNTVDDPPYPPSGFVYSKELRIPLALEIKMPRNREGCKCHGDCAKSRDCPCAKLNGKDFAYVRLNGGRLAEAKSIVYECGDSCKCGPKCINRTSQQGIKYHLEVFKTPTKGWAVRSWDKIPAGAPVCEYTGVLRRSHEVESNHGNKYLYDIDCLQTMNGLEGREKRIGVVPSTGQNSVSEEEEPEYCIDSAEVGNVARFINHSCTPNLFVQCVLSNHHDLKLAKIMFFAADNNIPPLEELTYDYGYALDSVVVGGEVKKLACHCGAAKCRKRLH